MPVLTDFQKRPLFAQAKLLKIDQLVNYIKTYENLQVADFQAYLDPDKFKDLEEALLPPPNPQEIEDWEELIRLKANATSETDFAILLLKIQNYMSTYGGESRNHLTEVRTLQQEVLQKQQQIQEKQKREAEQFAWDEISRINTFDPEQASSLYSKIENYIAMYGTISPNHVQEATQAKEQIKRNMELAREQVDWERLDLMQYDTMLAYLNKYPNTVHFDEIDDNMWRLTTSDFDISKLDRFKRNMPKSKHIQEADGMVLAYNLWEPVKNEGDLLKVQDYLQSYPQSLFKNEAYGLYYKLKAEELDKMKEAPTIYSKDLFKKLLSKGIFSKEEVLEAGVVTEKSLKGLDLDRKNYPDLAKLQIVDPGIRAPEGHTDVFFFGIPATGKTCLLMGLIGGNGKGYNLQMKALGGEYASALNEYVLDGLTPRRTFGDFVTIINGMVRSEKGEHPFNLIEMSGEEFALRIADNKEVSFEAMSTGVTNLLRNANRKVFFIIVDCTADKVTFPYEELIYDDDGNVVDRKLKEKQVSQLSILNKLTSLIILEENASIMDNVDAIHFVVTKADTLGEDCDEKAAKLLCDRYIGSVSQLAEFCRKTKRINRSTDYKPHVFTFSLGNFYIGDIYEYDNTDTLKIINVIKSITVGVKEKSWMDRISELLN